jgi:cardiolipin synthase
MEEMPEEREVELLAGGAVAFPLMLGAIAAAQKRIHIEVYRFRQDRTGEAFLEALTAASRRGVAVRVVVDGWGSLWDGRSLVSRLRSAGCDATVHNALRHMLFGRFQRNHRKLLLIDDQIVFLGGLNISDEQTGPKAWADLAVRVRGPASTHLAQKLRHQHPTAFSPVVQLVLSNEGIGRRLGRRYRKAIESAEHRVVLAQAYFLPDPRLLRAIRAAAKRGVEVTLLLPGRSDVPLARAAMRWYCRRLLAYGIQIFEWSGGVLHAKAASIDGRIALVGSLNLDPLSGLNLEALAEIHDVTFAAQLETWIQSLAEHARPLEPKSPGRWYIEVLRERFAALGPALAWRLMRRVRSRVRPGSRITKPGSKHRESAASDASRDSSPPN